MPVSVSTSVTVSSDTATSDEVPGEGSPTLERTAEVFDFFMRNVYATLPVINLDSFTRRLNKHPGHWDVEFCTLAFAIDMLHESYKYAVTPTIGTVKTLICMSKIEKLRCRYDFAEHPSADTVIVSFALFVAYSVNGKSRRALLYLSEASRLVEFVQPDNWIETMRIQRLKALLFITASASTLLSANPAWKIDVPLSSDVDELVSWYDMVGTTAIDVASQEIRELDRFAIRQLQLMTRLHLTARNENSRDFLGEADVANSISSVTLPATPMVRIVMADLSITQLWFSSHRRRLYSDGNDDYVLQFGQSVSLAETTGRKALAWARSLSQSELRIVGLGKLVDILENMVHQCTLDPHSTAEVEILARDLISAICTADYGSMYATTLARSAELLRHIASMYKETADHSVNSEVFEQLDT